MIHIYIKQNKKSLCKKYKNEVFIPHFLLTKGFFFLFSKIMRVTCYFLGPKSQSESGFAKFSLETEEREERGDERQ